MDVKEAGRKGGLTSAKNMTAKQRSIRAKHAAKVRWLKVKK